SGEGFDSLGRESWVLEPPVAPPSLDGDTAGVGDDGFFSALERCATIRSSFLFHCWPWQFCRLPSLFIHVSATCSLRGPQSLAKRWGTTSLKTTDNSPEIFCKIIIVASAVKVY
ncbi:hypothetical protein L9F63_013067, partial [Diploptera punctata]